jgi:predicted nucleic acid-binding protein
MYLLDTGVVFDLRRAKAGRADQGLAAWAAGVARHSLFISVLTLLELEAAAGRLERRDPAAGAAMRAWVEDQAAKAFDGRVLSVDAAVARRRARLAYADPRDALIAATALEHGLTLVTRNPQAFKAGRVKVFNPSGYAPERTEDDADWGQAARTGPVWLRNLFMRT